MEVTQKQKVSENQVNVLLNRIWENRGEGWEWCGRAIQYGAVGVNGLSALVSFASIFFAPNGMETELVIDAIAHAVTAYAFSLDQSDFAKSAGILANIGRLAQLIFVTHYGKTLFSAAIEDTDIGYHILNSILLGASIAVPKLLDPENYKPKEKTN
jgi:hypothetical protein